MTIIFEEEMAAATVSYRPSWLGRLLGRRPLDTWFVRWTMRYHNTRWLMEGGDIDADDIGWWLHWAIERAYTKERRRRHRVRVCAALAKAASKKPELSPAPREPLRTEGPHR